MVIESWIPICPFLVLPDLRFYLHKKTVFLKIRKPLLYWRRVRDSNPRSARTDTKFRVSHLRPLGQPSTPYFSMLVQQTNITINYKGKIDLAQTFLSNSFFYLILDFFDFVPWLLSTKSQLH